MVIYFFIYIFGIYLCYWIRDDQVKFKKFLKNFKDDFSELPRVGKFRYLFSTLKRLCLCLSKNNLSSSKFLMLLYFTSVQLALINRKTLYVESLITKAIASGFYDADLIAYLRERPELLTISVHDSFLDNRPNF
jgi:hypothetical protein